MSDIFFGKPEGDSRNFNPIKPTKFKSGVEFETHMNLVSAGLKKMNLKEPSQTSIEQFFTEARQRAKIVRDYAQVICDEHFAAGKTVDRKILLQELSSRLLDTYVHYNKDELLMLLAQFMAEGFVKQLT